MKTVNPEHLVVIRRMYDTEATDARLYRILARQAATEENRRILERIADDEEKHVRMWAQFVAGPPKVNEFKVRLFALLARVFGMVFVINLMESSEDASVAVYTELGKDVPVALEVLEDESRHEEQLINLLQEEKLSYISSMVLGLNDALVELTGALAGFTLALNDNTMIGLAGFITGVAATLSMAASEYLAKKAEPSEKHPLKAAIYTGCAYLVTVVLLLLPYGIFSNPLVSLAFCLVNATFVIVFFTYFVAIVRRQSFLKGFREMMTISFSVALISFLIGWAARIWLNVDV
ncbi:MAG: hypothetical protein DELT_02008 [Desulfovibrio sp.]